jgi:hypothetical protein
MIRGYIRRSVQDIVDDMAFYLYTDEETTEKCCMLSISEAAHENAQKTPDNFQVGGFCPQLNEA